MIHARNYYYYFSITVKCRWFFLKHQKSICQPAVPKCLTEKLAFRHGKFSFILRLAGGVRFSVLVTVDNIATVLSEDQKFLFL